MEVEEKEEIPQMVKITVWIKYIRLLVKAVI
jgi:hypothetical protein